MPRVPAFGRKRQEGQKFKVSLEYIVRLKPAWATWERPFLTKQNKYFKGVLVALALNSKH